MTNNCCYWAEAEADAEYWRSVGRVSAAGTRGEPGRERRSDPPCGMPGTL